MEKRIIVIKVGKEDYPTNCYLILDENNNGILIDPGFEKDTIINKIKEEKANVKKILLTHCHADHAGALDDVKEFTKAEVLIHENDASGIQDMEKSYFEMLEIPKQKITEDELIKIKDGDIIETGNIKLEVIHTPGHTNGCICLYEKELNALFTGDTIFYNCYGRCDLKSSNIEDMGNSIDKLFNRFENLTIYPGHEEIVNIDSVKRRIRLLYKIRNG